MIQLVGRQASRERTTGGTRRVARSRTSLTNAASTPSDEDCPWRRVFSGVSSSEIRSATDLRRHTFSPARLGALGHADARAVGGVSCCLSAAAPAERRFTYQRSESARWSSCCLLCVVCREQLHLADSHRHRLLAGELCTLQRDTAPLRHTRSIVAETARSTRASRCSPVRAQQQATQAGAARRRSARET